MQSRISAEKPILLNCEKAYTQNDGADKSQNGRTEIDAMKESLQINAIPLQYAQQ